MKQCIENPDDVDWVAFWAEKLASKKDKNWDEAAAGFYRKTKKDDYNDALFSKLILDENDTVLDVGCGEGSITIPIAKKVKKVIGIDSSPKMLEFLKKRAEDNEIFNIDTKKAEKVILKAKDIIIEDKFAPHQIALNEFVLNFRAKYGKIEYFDEKFLSGMANIRPDGMIRLDNCDLYIEQDMGSETGKQLRDK